MKNIDQESEFYCFDVSYTLKFEEGVPLSVYLHSDIGGVDVRSFTIAEAKIYSSQSDLLGMQSLSSDDLQKFMTAMETTKPTIIASSNTSKAMLEIDQKAGDLAVTLTAYLTIPLADLNLILNVNKELEIWISNVYVAAKENEKLVFSHLSGFGYRSLAV